MMGHLVLHTGSVCLCGGLAEEEPENDNKKCDTEKHTAGNTKYPQVISWEAETP